MVDRVLSAAECNFIRHELEINKPRQQKLVLQRLCSLHAAGFRIPSAARYSLEVFMAGLVMAPATDRKVRRWCLNTLALIGSKDQAIAAVRYAIDRFVDDPEIFGSAVSAMVRLDPDQFAHIASSENYPRDLVLLGGLRTVDAKLIDTTNLRVNIEVADSEVLKLTLLTVGLDRAPENIFDPRHGNPEIVKVLGGHHDPVVSQYTAWAIAENPKLGVDDLGIPVDDPEALPPNVRGWVFRLFAGDKRATSLRHEMILQGSMDQEIDVRTSTATGLRENFYDGLEQITIDWFNDETDDEVRGILLEHMVRNAGAFSPYEDIALRVFEAEAEGSRLRRRMEAAAARSSLYGKFQVIIHESGQPLFRDIQEVTVVMNGDKNTYSIQNLQSGATAFGGNATNRAEVKNLLSVQAQTEAALAMKEIEAFVAGLPIEQEKKAPVLSAIQDARAEPTKERMSAVAAALKGLEQVLGSVADAAGHVVKIAGYAALVLGLT